MSLSSPLPSGLWPDVPALPRMSKASLKPDEDRLEGWRRRDHTDRNSHP